MTATTINDIKPGGVAYPAWGGSVKVVGIDGDIVTTEGGIEWTVNGDGKLTPYHPPAPSANGNGANSAAASGKPSANLLPAALWYAAHGWRVMPLHEPLFDAVDSHGKPTCCTCEEWRRYKGNERNPANPAYVCDTPGKHPRIGDWENRATTDEAQIRKWWRAFPTANIGIAAGPSGLVCVDADTYHAPEGEELDIPREERETVTNLTGGGGEHLIYRHPGDGPQIRNDDKALPDWVNIRAHGGLFVAPPSLHYSGNRYEWETGYGPQDIAIAPLPDALRELLQVDGDGKRRAAPIPEKIAEGGRNNTLTSVAGSLRRRDLSAAVIETSLLAVNAAQCDPPLPEEEVKAIAKSVSQYPTGGNGSGANSAVAFKLDDTGNAERFVSQHGDGVRFNHSTGHWLIWTGTHWRRDDDGAAQRLAKETARAIYDEAATAAKAGNDDLAAQLAKWARTSAAESRRNAILNLARSENPIAITHDRLNTHDLLLNCQNGTLDLATGKLKPHDRGDLLTYVLPVAYDPAAECLLWNGFISRITNYDGDLERYLAAAVGLTLSGLTTAQCLFFLYGRGANGKSTFIETVMALMGDLGHKARAQILMANERERVPNEIAALAGRRLVVASELADGGRLNEGLVKDLTGGDTMSARFLYGEPFTFKPTFKLWLYGNHKPVITGTDDGIWRRVRLIPFTVQIPEDERDPDLAGKLRGELPGILSWAVRGWQDYRRHGLDAPAAVSQATAEYRSESDVIGIFLEERCYQHPDATARAGELYEVFTEWTTTNSIRPLSGVRFARTLKERDFKNERDRNGAFWQGIGILANLPAVEL